MNELLNIIVDAIVSNGNPDKIILFGSQARGDATDDSDIDILIIDNNLADQSSRARCFNYMRAVNQALRLSPMGIVDVDIIVHTDDEIVSWKDIRQSVIGAAMHDGKVLYELC